MSIKIISGDILTNLPTNKEVYICQQVNCRGVMGAGLALKIRRKWPVVYQLETKFQRDVKKTELPAKPDFAKIEELLVEINKSYLHRIM